MRASLKQGPDRLLSSKTRYTYPVAREGRDCINTPRQGLLLSRGVTLSRGLTAGCCCWVFPSKKDSIWIRHICVLLPMGRMLTISHLVREGWVGLRQKGPHRHHTALHVTAQSMLTSLSLAFLGEGATPGLWRGAKVLPLKRIQSLVHQ